MDEELKGYLDGLAADIARKLTEMESRIMSAIKSPEPRVQACRRNRKMCQTPMSSEFRRDIDDLKFLGSARPRGAGARRIGGMGRRGRPVGARQQVRPQGKFIYKGLASISRRDQGVVWPKTAKSPLQ
jgi:hypothetical protein